MKVYLVEGKKTHLLKDINANLSFILLRGLEKLPS